VGTSRSRCGAAAGSGCADHPVPGDPTDGAAAADDRGPSCAGSCQLAAGATGCLRDARAEAP
jgi:hypothetical protein